MAKKKKKKQNKKKGLKAEETWWAKVLDLGYIRRERETKKRTAAVKRAHCSLWSSVIAIESMYRTRIFG